MCEITVVKKEHKKNYTTIDLSAANDKRLSWGAVGLHLYLYSRASIQGWDIRRSDLLARHKEGERALQTLINELKQSGYMRITRSRDPLSGKINGAIYEISEVPVKEWIQVQDETIHADQAVDQPQDGKTTTYKTAVMEYEKKRESKQQLTAEKNPPSSYKKDNIYKKATNNKSFKPKQDKFYLQIYLNMKPKDRYLFDCEALDGMSGVRAISGALTPELNGKRVGYLKLLDQEGQLERFKDFWPVKEKAQRQAEELSA